MIKKRAQPHFHFLGPFVSCFLEQFFQSKKYGKEGKRLILFFFFKAINKKILNSKKKDHSRESIIFEKEKKNEKIEPNMLFIFFFQEVFKLCLETNKYRESKNIKKNYFIMFCITLKI